MKRLLHIFLLTAVFAAMLVAPAHALEYTIDEPEDYLFGRPTSEDAPYTAENPNMDRSKNTALIPPGFGTPTSYLPGSGKYLTPNLVPGALSGGLVNQVGSVGGGTVTNSGYPTVDVGGAGSTSQFSYTTTQTTAYTEVTSDLYYSGGYLGLPGDAENPLSGRERQNLRGNGQRPACQGRGPLHQHQHLERQRLPCWA